MIRCSKRCSAPLLAGGLFSAATLLAACQARGPAFESVAVLPEEPRRPAGTDVEPKFDLPGSTRSADTSGGLVVLESPADPAAARAAVAGFFRAVAEESPTELDALLTPQAMIQSGSRRELLRSHFQLRFSRLDYRSLSGEMLYRDADLELWERAPPGSEARSTAPVTPNERELVARARITAPWVGRPRLFGDELVFRLVPSGRGWAISEVVEDFRLP